ncbi:NAD-P-binding protein [Amanita muscaria]
MKILILGATGPSGILLVQKCLEHYPQATLVLYLRSPSKVPKDIAENPAVVVVEGQLDDVEALSKAMEGIEAVLSSLGPSGPIYPSDTPIAKGYANIISIMQQQEVRRLICLGTTAIKDPNDKSSLKFALIVQGVKTLAYNAYKEVVAIGDTVRASDLDWTIVRVPFLTNGRSTDVVAGYVGDGQDSIFLTREGFAEFVVKEIEKREWVKKAPLLSSGTKKPSD